MGLLHLSKSPGNSKSWKTMNNEFRITKFFMIMYNCTEKDPKDPPRSTKLMVRGAIFSNPLNFKHHPLEGAGVYLFDHFFYVSFWTHGGLQL